MDVERKAMKPGEGSQMPDNLVWKTLWHLRVPNSTRVFLWRACKNILPTRDNFLRRGIIKDDLCCFCSGALETVIHVLWECLSAMDVWGVSWKCIQKSCQGGDSFRSIVEVMIHRCCEF